MIALLAAHNRHYRKLFAGARAGARAMMPEFFPEIRRPARY